MVMVRMPDGTAVNFSEEFSPEDIRDYVITSFPELVTSDQGTAPGYPTWLHLAQPSDQPESVPSSEPPAPVYSDEVPAVGEQVLMKQPYQAVPDPAARNKFGQPEAAPERPQFHRPFEDVPVLGPAYAASQAFQSGALQGATFGFADEIVAGMQTPFQLGADAFRGRPFDVGRAYGESLEGVREYDRWVQEGNPWAYGIGNFAGSIMPGVGVAKTGLTLMNAAKPVLTSFVPRAATEGAIYGAIQGFGSGESWEDRVNRALEGAKMGALFGAATGAVGGSIASKSSQSAIPSVIQLKDEARGLYEAAGRAGAMLSPQQSAAMVDSMRQIAINRATMTHAGEFVGGNPMVAGVIKEIDGFGQGPLSIDQIQSARTFIENALKSPNEIERRTARDMLLEFHRHLDTISPEIASANAMYHRSANADMLETLVRAAAREADQGKQSLYALLRQRFGDLEQQILEGHAQGFSEAEREAISSLAQGGPLENVLALIGEASAPVVTFAAGGAGAAATKFTGDPAIGAAVGGVAGTTTGWAARKGLDALSRNNAQQVIQRALLGNDPLPPAHPAISPVTQALIAGQSSQAPQISDELMWFVSAPN